MGFPANHSEYKTTSLSSPEIEPALFTATQIVLHRWTTGKPWWTASKFSAQIDAGAEPYLYKTRDELEKAAEMQHKKPPPP